MSTKGQLVEIPEDSPLYSKTKPLFRTKEEELRHASQQPQYSLFDGFLVGDHPGTEHFKPGQRKGINVGGKKAPLYVIAIDRNENRVFVGAGKHHPALWTKVLSCTQEQLLWNPDFTFLTEEGEEGIPVTVAAQSLVRPADAELYLFGNAIYLEAQEQFPITLQDEELILRRGQHIIATLKNNNIN